MSALKQYHTTPDLEKIIFIPPQKNVALRQSWRLLPFVWRWTPPRTLLFEEDHILIVEGTETENLKIILIPNADLLAIQLDSVLLYSAFTLSWALRLRWTQVSR